jgi:hypothetical protein
LKAESSIADCSFLSAAASNLDHAANDINSVLNDLYSVPSTVPLYEKYMGGAVCITIKLNIPPNGDIFNLAKSIEATYERFSIKPEMDGMVFVENRQLGRFGGADNGRDDFVLISPIKAVKEIEQFALSTGVDFARFKKRIYRNESGFDPVTGSFIRPLIGPRGEFEVPVVLIPASTDKNFPREMVIGANKIVDSIAYYERSFVGKFLSKDYLDCCLSCFFLVLDHASVRLFRYKGFDLPFEVGDVIIRPI